MRSSLLLVRKYCGRELVEDARTAGCTYVEVGLDPTKLAVKGQVTQKEVVAAALR